MLKPIKISLILIAIITGITSCNENKFVEYKPHYLNPENDHRYFGEAELDSSDFANTIHVLTYYREDFKTENDNVILITKELLNDWDLVWNYTSKANDPDWLSTHQPD